MTTAAPNRAKIPTDSPQLVRNGARQSALRAKVTAESPQPGRGRAGGALRAKKGSAPARPKVIATGTGRESTRGGGEVIELECGITVYPARSESGRWRAVWYEAGARQQCEAATEAKLAPKLEKIAERLRADAPNMRRPGADLIAHYLDPDRLPVRDRWSRKHADTQWRLCERFAAPVIAAATCQDIKRDRLVRLLVWRMASESLPRLSVAGAAQRKAKPSSTIPKSDPVWSGLALGISVRSSCKLR